MNRAIPIINTSRLTLRAMLPEDFDSYADIWSDPEVVRHIGGHPWSRGRAWTSFLRNAGHWQMTGFGQWAVADGRSRQLIGQAGFFFGENDLGDDFDPYPEAGWVLRPGFHGNGLGREAAGAAHDWFDRVIKGPLVAKIAVDNAPSLHLAEKLGYRDLRRVEMDVGAVLLMRRERPPG
jgi:RimJ/RimL family protein N-acetyltransferase